VTLWKEGRTLDDLTDQLLAIAFGAWGAIWVGSSLAKGLSCSALAVTTLVPFAAVATLSVVAVNERDKRDTQRNMLALSNINLATSTFVGGAIQRILSAALERVLGLAELPVGVLLLVTEPPAPVSAVVRGVSDEFCGLLQKEELDRYLIELVARVGGLLGFRDLRNPESIAAFEREEPIRRFRQLALAQGLRSVVAISLQAKEQAFGVLLLGTPDSRRFAPAEYRLVLALGHQIGMAVENSYLVQQTSRRSEELHVLNEIGRALSSTLNREELLSRVWEELRRLFAVENFYIAELDPVHDEMRFHLEVIGGMRMQRRSRRAGNHLTEYVIRTRQPVLIRDNYVAEVQKLGVVPLRSRGCFCCVPLVAYDHAIGAMAVFSDHEHAFDEGHLELLRVLASEASIAIENARLFHEERTKARHLSLLNTISRNAIATLNPDEMLAKITEQLETGLTYDHVGIGVLDYSTQEVVIHSEGGKRRGALGQRVPLGTGLIGHVARNGQLAVYSASLQGLKPLLPDTLAAIALPAFYAEQLHGILYVESSQPQDFSEEEMLLLRTLADLIAGVLHNALTFQKAQEQAVTDGLTGLKNHRVFETSLRACCKDSARANGTFALIFMDLDGFKAVNDGKGHLKGDEVLRTVANILRKSVEGSSVLARNGGDEFAAILTDCGAQRALLWAEKIKRQISEDVFLVANAVTASIGVAVFPQHGSTSLDLLRAADTAMYEAKKQGGNRVSVAPPRE